MNTQFYIVFSLRISHGYFEKRICNCISFAPNADTQKLIRRFGFRLRQKTNGFEFYSTNKDFARYLKYIQNVTGQSEFAFEMTCANEHFSAFTESPSSGKWQFSSAKMENGMQLTPTIGQSAAISGTLQIRFSDLIGCAADHNPEFEISFKAKATQWQYYIINKNDVPLQNPMVTGKSGIKFTEGIAVTIPTGEKALLFSSSEPIVLSESPQLIFDLVGQSKTNPDKPGKPVIRGLPNPNPARTATVETDGKKTEASPMYVYI